MAELPESVDRHIREGRTILAVKAIRESQGCSLHEAVDLYAQRFRELHPEPDAASGQPRGPRVLRFEPDGSLVVFEDNDGQKQEGAPGQPATARRYREAT